MAALSYMQRRASGVYEFRKRLPEALAGKPVPSHMRDVFPDLVNPKTRCFIRRQQGCRILRDASRAGWNRSAGRPCERHHESSLSCPWRYDPYSTSCVGMSADHEECL